MPTFEKLAATSVRARIADRLREAILDGSLLEGERLVERKLAAEFGASLTAVREALIELETEGFIAKLPNSSTHVIRITVDDAEKILAAREVLEAFAASEAVNQITASQMKLLMELQAGVLAAADSADLKVFLQKDLQLHETIWEIAGGEHLFAALRRLVMPFYAFCAIRLHDRKATELSQCAEANIPFLNAICAKDPDLARKALRYTLARWMEIAKGPAGAASGAAGPAAAAWTADDSGLAFGF
ncbi:MAG: GntR family transcriptional regulator [Bryobacteraceae bacterium]